MKRAWFCSSVRKVGTIVLRRKLFVRTLFICDGVEPQYWEDKPWQIFAYIQKWNLCCEVINFCFAFYVLVINR
ncbi:hypothetical protein L6164_031001 [Bauhinia variegata]|uniref:Uncharacterized protein n=1 Tax=Bauhinia variegata TaxID=167791 RepID=A0ACB9LDI7_BAUVA|nr:hypothetical protein L6164_031001 [Bauhinia variegata]